MGITITAPAAAKLWAFIELMNTEVGGFGLAKHDAKTDSLTWEDTFLVPQYVSAAEVDFDADAMEYAVNKFGDQLDDPAFVPVSWHSHHSMKAFWSNTDEDCIKKYGKAGMDKLLSFVGCHDHEYRLRLDFFRVEHAGFVIPQVTMDKQELLLDTNDSLYSGVVDELEACIKKRPTPAKPLKPLKHNKTSPPPVHVVGETLAHALEVQKVMEEFGVTQKKAEHILRSGTQDESDFYRYDTYFDHQASGGLV